VARAGDPLEEEVALAAQHAGRHRGAAGALLFRLEHEVLGAVHLVDADVGRRLRGDAEPEPQPCQGRDDAASQDPTTVHPSASPAIDATRARSRSRTDPTSNLRAAPIIRVSASE